MKKELIGILIGFILLTPIVLAQNPTITVREVSYLEALLHNFFRLFAVSPTNPSPGDYVTWSKGYSVDCDTFCGDYTSVDVTFEDPNGQTVFIGGQTCCDCSVIAEASYMIPDVGPSGNWKVHYSVYPGDCPYDLIDSGTEYFTVSSGVTTTPSECIDNDWYCDGRNVYICTGSNWGYWGACLATEDCNCPQGQVCHNVAQSDVCVPSTGTTQPVPTTIPYPEPDCDCGVINGICYNNGDLVNDFCDQSNRRVYCENSQLVSKYDCDVECKKYGSKALCEGADCIWFESNGYRECLKCIGIGTKVTEGELACKMSDASDCCWFVDTDGHPKRRLVGVFTTKPEFIIPGIKTDYACFCVGQAYTITDDQGNLVTVYEGLSDEIIETIKKGEVEPGETEEDNILAQYPWILIIIPPIIGYYFAKGKERKKKAVLIGLLIGGIAYYLYTLPAWVKWVAGIGIIGGMGIFVLLGGGSLIMYFLTSRRK